MFVFNDGRTVYIGNGNSGFFSSGNGRIGAGNIIRNGKSVTMDFSGNTIITSNGSDSIGTRNRSRRNNNATVYRKKDRKRDRRRSKRSAESYEDIVN